MGGAEILTPWVVGPVRTVLIVGVAIIASLAVKRLLRGLHASIVSLMTRHAGGLPGELVRDVISGFFMLVENQIRISDVVVINGTGGLVEEINLRQLESSASTASSSSRFTEWGMPG